MKNYSFGEKTSKPRKNKKRFSKQTSFVITAVVIIALIGIGALIFSKSPRTVSAQQAGKKYKATKNIVVDRSTGEVRKPTTEELTDLVKTLQATTKRSDENLQSSPVAGGGVALDLDGGYGGTILARPNADGTMETRCVFSFEEAAEFLGLVEDIS
ncbi:MAG TPA: hypothetical protein VGC97_04665 [Pyrinomonadaceae bacterium]|jgi:hypothetical protein